MLRCIPYSYVIALLLIAFTAGILASLPAHTLRLTITFLFYIIDVIRTNKGVA
jgi:hypothetical protein